mmetsp:Transcript_145309/g.253599  ORF Transcript_145309/g.253599 Transcript_145309/m.253599 type:complete len:334 (+) Transcript_145309:98-1099(+)
MEVTVLDAQNSPRKPVLAIQAGGALRHVDLAVNQPFTLPNQGLQDGRVKVSLYQQLGTQIVPEADEPEFYCNVPVRSGNGSVSQVKLRLRRNDRGAGSQASTVGIDDYLSKHQLEKCIQNLFEDVLRKQPEDPYRCMIDQLRKLKGDKGESKPAVEEVTPKKPAPPAEPCPKSRPSPAAKGRSMKQQATEVEGPSDRGMTQSTSLFNERADARQAGAQKLSNMMISHEVARMVIRKIGLGLVKESSSMSEHRQAMRANASKASAAREAVFFTVQLAMQGAYARLTAQSLGLVGGGHSTSDDIRVPRKAKDETAVAAAFHVVRHSLQVAARSAS